MDLNSPLNTVTLRPAALSEQRLLVNLCSLYLHELSEYSSHLQIDEEGLFQLASLPVYWTDTHLHPLLAFVADHLLGFILFSESPYAAPGCDDCIQEFFILKPYRRQGLGRAAARELFRLYPGRHSLLVLEKNRPALRFWQDMLQRSSIPFEERMVEQDDGVHCFELIFDA